MRRFLLMVMMALVASLLSTRADAQGFLDGGLTGSYYASSDFSGAPSFTRNDVRVRFAWKGAAPGGSISQPYAAVPAAGFSVRWKGRLVAPASGAYTFTVSSSGPASLYLTAGSSRQEVIHYSGSTTATTTGRFNLVAGQTYAVRLDFQDKASPALAELSWTPPGGTSDFIETAHPLGVNMTSTADWDGGRIFADAMKQSRGWCVLDSNCASLVLSDAQGWPTQDFLVVPVAGPPELNGAYRVQFKGLASVYINFGYGSFSVGGQTYGPTLPSGAGYDAATNTTTAFLTLNPTEGINVFLNFTATQRNPSATPGTGITDIKMMRPLAPGSASAYGSKVLFTGALEAALAPFSTIRFMDYFSTNGNPIAHWADRTLPATPSQAQRNGGAIEYAVMLANETGKDLWLNIPVSAGPGFVRRLALLLRYGGDGVNPYSSPQAHPVYPPVQPNLNVYLEYSNEVWNFSFQQATTNLNLAEAEVAQGGSPLNFDGTTNIYVWGFRRVAEQAVAISDTFRDVWGDGAMGTRIRPVLEWQGGNGQATADTETQLLSDFYDNADGVAHVATPHPPRYYVWGGGGAWYYGVNTPTAASVPDIYASGVVLPGSEPLDAQWTHAFGLNFAGYEGGFEIGGDNPTTLQLAADLDPAAQAAEASGLAYSAAQTGEGLALIYTIAGHSAYGLVNPTIYDIAAPKMEAVNAFVGAPPPPNALGIPVSGVATLTPPTADAAHDMWGPFGATVNIGAGCWLNWTLNVEVAGVYTVTTNLGVVAGQKLFVDGVEIGNSGASATLSVGVHGLHVRNLGSQGSLALSSVTVKAK